MSVRVDLSSLSELERTRRQIIDRLCVAEFGSRTVTERPHALPELWEEILGEPIDPVILAKAAKAWEEGR